MPRDFWVACGYLCAYTMRMAIRKVPANLSVKAELVERARALGVNLSEVLEAALEEAIRQREQARWLEENEEAIDDYNAHIARNGSFGDTHRRF